MMILTICLMAGITFAVRYAFFSQRLKFELSVNAKQFLSFSGPCVLAAMTAPILFTDFGEATWLSPYLLAGIVAIVLSLFIERTIVVVLISMAAYFTLKLL